MAFQNDVVEAAWKKSGGKCVCQRTSHYYHRESMCGKPLVLESRGNGSGRGAWQAHARDGNPDNGVLANCEILCWDCHKESL